MPKPSRGEGLSLELDGRPLETSYDVARLFQVPHAQLLWILYKAPDGARYTSFEILKRSGGMRVISSPNGLIRQVQTAMLPMLQAAYEAHPAAHGFIHERSVVTNAREHVGRRWVLNVDLEDFFPTINFGRVRGLFMSQPFRMGPKAAAVCAQICTWRNGLPQGAPTSPTLANFIASSLDRQLMRLARDHRLQYSRYADDITFSSVQPEFPPAVAYYEVKGGKALVRAGDELERAITASGFAINHRKVRLQGPNVRKTVTGLTVNVRINVERQRIRRVRAMIHAWQKHGLEAAGSEHVRRYRKSKRQPPGADPAALFRNAVYGELAYIKMVRGADDRTFLTLCSRLVGLDPNPSRFIRQMVFGAADYDVFISHASEDKAAIARPIFEACEKVGLKAFLDEEHIAWGESFTRKINTALGSARTILAIISPVSVAKDWPLTEVNTALALEVAGEKTVVPLMVGKPDLVKLPLIRGKDWLEWTGDPHVVARRLREISKPAGRETGHGPKRASPSSSGAGPSVPQVARADTPGSAARPSTYAQWWQRMFGDRK